MSGPLSAQLADRLRRLPLRLRLVAVVLTLLVVALTVSGVASALLIRKYLTDRIDVELRAYADVAAQVAAAQLEAGRPSILPPDYAVVFTFLGANAAVQVEAVPAASVASTPAIPVLNVSDVRVTTGRPFTVASARGEAISWRVVAGVNTSGDAIYAVAKPMSGITATIERFTTVAALVSLAVLGACAILGWYAVRRAFRPLTMIEDTAATIAAGDLSRRVPEPPTGDEVASLAASLNAMLAQIEQSFAVREASEQRMRQFVADASHELRTPLATVRGYAELYRHGALPDEESTLGAMGRIEAEAARMAGLVEDLLLLARLDGERPLERAEVDLSVVAADVVQDAKARAPERAIRVAGLGGPLSATVVLGDEARLRQVVTNLLSNALTYTPEGSPIEVLVGAAADIGSGSAELRVVDHGPGVDPAHARAVFERFFRADKSRARATGGNGLGLAIVAAIVGAHGGRAGVSQTPGGGATFHMVLPTGLPQAVSRGHG